jgi:enamine deaminase RidA (YjgF/YER057c/UK114 family)
MDNGERTIRYVNPPELNTPRGYTHVVDTRGQRTIYISGQIALDQSGNIVGANDLQAQAVQIFENIKNALAGAGASFNDVVKLTLYFVDITNVQVVRDVRDRYINTANPPASTAVEIRRLVRPELLLEIEAVAVIA